MTEFKYLTIKNEKIPVRISFLALNWFQMANGKGFEQLENYTIDNFIELVYYGIHASAMHNKEELDYRIEDLYIDIDTDPTILTQINDLFSENNTNNVENKVESKKNM